MVFKDFPESRTNFNFFHSFWNNKGMLAFAYRAFCNKCWFFCLFFDCCCKFCFAAIAFFVPSHILPCSPGKSPGFAWLKELNLVRSMLVAFPAIIAYLFGNVHKTSKMAECTDFNRQSFKKEYNGTNLYKPFHIMA